MENSLVKYLGRPIGMALDRHHTLCEEVANEEIMKIVVTLSPKVSIQGTEFGMKLMVKGQNQRLFVAYDSSGNQRDWKKEFIEECAKFEVDGVEAINKWGQKQIEILKEVKLSEPIQQWSEDLLERAEFYFTHAFDPAETRVWIKVFDAATGKEKRKYSGSIAHENSREFAKTFTSPLSAQGHMVMLKNLEELNIKKAENLEK